ncbi:hypothetical protein EWM64_g6942 [Hericium alpestre]|uniref:Uncharacterized protein n=1 Tax=Hericium alpestre TaxID=135208 RepID=A0A4Y9ZU92_9AGAM|nr:hypothetical protein EWM64_g6942 [Hericium alpestre]
MASQAPGMSTPPQLPPPPPAPNIPTGQNGVPNTNPSSKPTDHDMDSNGLYDNTPLQELHDLPHYPPPDSLQFGPIRLPSNDAMLGSSVITTLLASISSYFLSQFTPAAFDNPDLYYQLLAPIQASIKNLITTWNWSTGDALTSSRPQPAPGCNVPSARGPASLPPRGQPASQHAVPSRPAPSPQFSGPHSFAQAAAQPHPHGDKGKGPASGGATLDIVRGLATAFPALSIQQIADMAARLSPPSSQQPPKKPTIRHAPKGANKAITVSYTGT